MALHWNFQNVTLTWIEGEIAKLNADKSAGKTVVSSGAGDSNLSERVESSIGQREVALTQDRRQLVELGLTITGWNTAPAARRTRVRFA